MVNQIAIVSNVGLSPPNDGIANTVQVIVENCSNLPIQIIENSKDKKIENSLFVCVSLQGGRYYTGTQDGLSSFLDTCTIHKKESGFFSSLFQNNAPTPNTNIIGALVLDYEPSESEPLFSFAIKSLSEEEEKWVSHHFCNTQDSAFKKNEQFYASDPTGIFSIRRIFSLKILQAALDPNYSATTKGKYSKEFLQEYLEHFKYAVQNPFTSTLEQGAASPGLTLPAIASNNLSPEEQIIESVKGYLVKREQVVDKRNETKPYYNYGLFRPFGAKSYTEKKDAIDALTKALNHTDAPDLLKHLPVLRDGELGNILRDLIRKGLGSQIVGEEVHTVSEFVNALAAKMPKKSELKNR